MKSSHAVSLFVAIVSGDKVSTVEAITGLVDYLVVDQIGTHGNDSACLATVGKLASMTGPKGKRAKAIADILADAGRKAKEARQDASIIATLACDAIILILCPDKVVRTDEEKAADKAKREQSANERGQQWAADNGYVSPDAIVSIADLESGEIARLTGLLDEARAESANLAEKHGQLRGLLAEKSAEIVALKSELSTLTALVSKVQESGTIKAVRALFA